MKTDWKYISTTLPKTKGKQLRRAVYEKAGLTNVDEFLKLQDKKNKMYFNFFKKYPEIKRLPQEQVLAIMGAARH